MVQTAKWCEAKRHFLFLTDVREVSYGVGNDGDFCRDSVYDGVLSGYGGVLDVVRTV